MEGLLYIVAATVNAFIDIIMWLLLIRVVMGWFAMADEDVENGGLFTFVAVVTEPVMLPARALLSKIPALDDSPIDFSYIATCFLLIIVQSALPLS